MHRAERSGKTEVSFFTSHVYVTVIRLRSRANRGARKISVWNLLVAQCSCSNYYNWEKTMLKKSRTACNLCNSFPLNKAGDFRTPILYPNINIHRQK